MYIKYNLIQTEDNKKKFIKNLKALIKKCWLTSGDSYLEMFYRNIKDKTYIDGDVIILHYNIDFNPGMLKQLADFSETVVEGDFNYDNHNDDQ